MSLVKRALELKKGSKVRKQVEEYLNYNYNNSKSSDDYDICEYVGKSKIIKTSKVYIIKDLGESVRIEDMEGNKTTVKKKMIISKSLF